VQLYEHARGFENAAGWGRVGGRQLPQNQLQINHSVGRKRCALVTLASSTDADNEKLATLMFATSPAAYSALEPRDVGRSRVIPSPRSQGDCSTCTAFVAATAAEVRRATRERERERDYADASRG
jgi:hypothetical protein